MSLAKISVSQQSSHKTKRNKGYLHFGVGNQNDSCFLIAQFCAKHSWTVDERGNLLCAIVGWAVNARYRPKPASEDVGEIFHP